MNNIFDAVDKFFSSFANYLNYNRYFIIFSALFLFTVFCVIISTSHSYESRLIKAIDMFNNYFLDNPQINEDNLIAFNNKMKSNHVPKQLRKQWQQYVLYREEKASKYMSFENCVSTPVKNSTFTRDVRTMNILAYIFASVCFLLNIYCSYEDKFSDILQHCLLCPVLILLLNYLVTIFFSIKHNAIISDLYSNYQYFEVNIDKATETLPDYVDYEVLFDKNEIRRGIPILYAYLQKRAEEEKKELERARLRNVEHEKFNFDEAGIERSLVLERAMTEAENYIAERKKLMQDMEQINNEIYQEENSFRETTKEYQRQMQVSKETFDNFKQQLENVTSSIEANYLKKQQQQELDRQRNLERDYDAATDKHKNILNTYQEEISAIEAQITKARNILEKSMMSEFDTYSGKVYDEALRVVENREADKYAKVQENIKNLEERLKHKEEEVNGLYDDNEQLKEHIANLDSHYQQQIDERDAYINQQYGDANAEQADNALDNSQEYYDDNQNYYDDNQGYYEDASNGEQETSNETTAENEQNQTYSFEDNQPKNQDASVAGYTFNYLDEPVDDGNIVKPDFEDNANNQSQINTNEQYSANFGENAENASNSKSEEKSTVQNEESKSNNFENVATSKKHPGRPRKAETEKQKSKPKGKRGRPKKVEQLAETKPAKKRGRPKKQQSENVEKVEKKPVGRPRKKVDEQQPKNKNVGKRGRPKKVEQTVVNNTKKAAEKPAEKTAKTKKTTDINDIDEFLKQIDEEIAKENEKFKKSKIQLAKNSKIKNKK